MLKKLIDYEFENLIQQLNQAKCIYDTPVEYLQGILKRKYEYPTYSDEDWELVEKEENELVDDLKEEFNKFEFEEFTSGDDYDEE